MPAGELREQTVKVAFLSSTQNFNSIKFNYFFQHCEGDVVEIQTIFALNQIIFSNCEGGVVELHTGGVQLCWLSASSKEGRVVLVSLSESNRPNQLDESKKRKNRAG